ncbi:MAG: universal stress protein [Anaerolineales bacterium]
MAQEPSDNNLGFTLARDDFRRARQRASLQEILSRFTGKSADLLSFEDVREKLHAVGSGVDRGVRNIPLDSIVGSVGRYSDFSRTFLPKNPSDEERWARVMSLVTDPAGSGLPPIQVIKIGDAYFVQDGHHRVSVARQLGAETIEAYVNEIHTDIPLSPESDPDDLIRKQEFVSFLETTQLNKTRPDADLEVTVAGMYAKLLEHIQVHRYFMGQAEHRDVPVDEAAIHWYDTIYRPVVEAIRERNILREFPGRTEADLYLWVSEHRSELQQGWGEFISPQAAAEDLAGKFGTRAGRVAARIGKTIADAVVPDALESGPPPGAWRESKASRDAECLFDEILVPINGEADGWTALDQAIQFARRECARIHGLHILPADGEAADDRLQSLRVEFSRRCEAAGFAGGLAVERGDVTKVICDRALLADIVILTLSHPPADQPFPRLGTGFSALIRQCARPILAVPGNPTPLDSALIAYDGSAKAREALFVAAYLSARWNIPLTVLSVEGPGVDAEDMLEEADEYLHTRGVRARQLLRAGSVAGAILDAAEETDSHLLILGGYGRHPVLGVVLGSQVDEVLRRSRLPMLICR